MWIECKKTNLNIVKRERDEGSKDRRKTMRNLNRERRTRKAGKRVQEDQAEAFTYRTRDQMEETMQTKKGKEENKTVRKTNLGQRK